MGGRNGVRTAELGAVAVALRAGQNDVTRPRTPNDGGESDDIPAMVGYGAVETIRLNDADGVRV